MVGLAVELLATRQVRAAFKTMPVKTDRKDARGIAPLMVDGAAIDGLVPLGALQVVAGTSLIAPRSSGHC